MRKYSLLSILLVLLVLFACETFDHTPPEVVIDSPNPLAPVMDITRVEITATDDEEMAYVELLVNGAQTGLVDSTAPYSINWSTYDYENGTDVYLSARAWDASENSTESERVQVKIVNDDYYPAALDVIKITYDNDGFTLLWDESADTDFESYTLRKYSGSLLDSAVIAFQSFNIADHSYRDLDIDPLVQYFYRVTVTDTFGLSTAGRHNLSPDPRDYAPSGLFASTADNAISIRWIDNCPFESGFIIERDEGTGFFPIDTVDANTTGFTDDSLMYDIYYRYRVAGYTDINQTEYSSYAGISSPLEFAPTNLAAVASDTTIELSWKDNALFEDGFRIERSEGAGYIQIAEVSANTTSFVDFNLDEDKYYTYRVAAYTSTLQSNYTFSVTISSPLSFAPNSLYATTTETSILLRWNDNCIFEDGFIVERDGGFGYNQIAQLPANTAGFTDTALVFDVTYRYQVAAFTNEKQSAYSQSISVQSPLLYTPTNLSAEGTDTSIVLKWDDNCIFEDGFIVERRMDAGYVQIAQLGVNATSYEDSDLIEDEFYSYRIAAYTDDNQSNYSISVSIASPIQFAPNGLSASTVGNSIVLRWTDNCSFEEGFIVERDDGSGFIEITQLGRNYTSFTDDSLEYDKLYIYRVAAFTSTQQSKYSAGVTIASPVSFAPTNLQIASEDTQLRLTWTDNSDFEEGFFIERDEGAGFVKIDSVRYNYTYFSDNSLAYGVLYTYRVAAYTSSQTSDYSNSIVIESPIRLAPTNLTGTVQDTTITISWEDNSIVEEGFRIERDAGAGFVQIAEIGADTTSYLDRDMGYETDYRYRVRAFVGSDQSDYTQILSISSPLKFTPTELAAQAADTTISLTWVDNSIFEDGYRIERDAGTGYSQIAQVSANTTSYTDSDLVENGFYYYRVAAFDGADQSNYSNEVTISSPVIFTPTDLIISITGTTVHLEWTDDCLFEDGFRIERDSGAGFVQIAEIGSDTTTYGDNYLSYGTYYEYRVAAFEGIDQSDYSNIVSAQIEELTDSEWVTVSGGDYTFGENDDTRSDLADNFDIMKYEVTNAQFVSFLEEAWATYAITVTVDSITAPYAGDVSWAADDYLIYNFLQAETRIRWNESYFTIEEGYENHPVVGVTWFGAYAFAEHYGWTLPTEYQWEKATRGNTGNDFPWGDNAPTCELAHMSECGTGTIPVGQTSGISPFGVYDMVGNAWEWVNSFDGGGVNRMIRGGSWSFYSEEYEVWNSVSANPKLSYYRVGFRCVK